MTNEDMKKLIAEMEASRLKTQRLEQAVRAARLAHPLRLTYRLSVAIKVETPNRHKLCRSCGCSDFVDDAFRFGVYLVKEEKEQNIWREHADIHATEMTSLSYRWITDGNTSSLSPMGTIHCFGGGFHLFENDNWTKNEWKCSLDDWLALKHLVIKPAVREILCKGIDIIE